MKAGNIQQEQISVINLNHYKGHIFSHVRPSYEQAVSDLDRSMHTSVRVQVAHSLFIEGSLMTKNTASGQKVKKIKSVIKVSQMAPFTCKLWPLLTNTRLSSKLSCNKHNSLFWATVGDKDFFSVKQTPALNVIDDLQLHLTAIAK